MPGIGGLGAGVEGPPPPGTLGGLAGVTPTFPRAAFELAAIGTANFAW
jgi:hypothetical protein